VSPTPVDDNLGSLPRSGRNAELEELSFKAFDRILPPDRFCLRDQRGKDKGVDASLEIVCDGRNTNFLAQVQLKGTDSENINEDGSVSLPVATSNLNYLLNGPSPLYVLYVAPRDELWYAWAHDERRRLDAVNEGWMHQGEVTIRFRDRLVPEALSTIHDRIRREGQLRRRILDSLGRATTAERLVVSIDPKTLGTTDPEEVRQLMLAGGMSAVAAGYAQEVLALSRVLNPEAARLPRTYLICAYAQYTLGRYLAALGHLAEAEIGAQELSQTDRRFLGSLRNACDYETGRISREQYIQRQEVQARQAGHGATLEHRLNSLRYELATESDPDRRLALVQQLHTVVTEIEADRRASPAFRLQARLVALQEEGLTGVIVFSRAVGLQQMRHAMGLPPDVHQVRDAFQIDREHTQRWEREVEEALQQAVAQQHPLLLGEALLVRVLVRLVLISDRSAAIIFSGRSPPQVPEAVIHPLMNDAEQAIRIFARAGNLEGELRARMLLADLSDLAGQENAARSMAEDVLPRARAMGYAHIESLAMEHLSGGCLRRQLETLIRQRSIDGDYHLAAADEEEVRRFARDCLEASGLPQERFPIVERECFSLRDVAREHVHWCRHLDLIQDLRHTQHAATHYREDPERWCHCARHGYTSAIPSTDWPPLIVGFKLTRCQDCPDRDPKNRVTSPAAR
jgi:hypothetical protein